MVQVGDNIIIDNTNPYNAMTEFKNSILDPIYYQLTGQRKVLVQRWLCAWNEIYPNDPTPHQVSKYLSTKDIDEDPMKFSYVVDEKGNKITKSDWEDTTDPDAVRIVNDKGANYIIHELGKIFNDKVQLGTISRDEAVITAADSVASVFSYIIFNEFEYGLKDATQLIVCAQTTIEFVYIFLTSLEDGKAREALVAILTGGGFQYKRDDSQSQAPQNGNIKTLQK